MMTHNCMALTKNYKSWSDVASHPRVKERNCCDWDVTSRGRKVYAVSSNFVFVWEEQFVFHKLCFAISTVGLMNDISLFARVLRDRAPTNSSLSGFLEKKPRFFFLLIEFQVLLLFTFLWFQFTKHVNSERHCKRENNIRLLKCKSTTPRMEKKRSAGKAEQPEECLI